MRIFAAAALIAACFACMHASDDVDSSVWTTRTVRVHRTPDERSMTTVDIIRADLDDMNEQLAAMRLSNSQCGARLEQLHGYCRGLIVSLQRNVDELASEQGDVTWQT